MVLRILAVCKQSIVMVSNLRQKYRNTDFKGNKKTLLL